MLWENAYLSLYLSLPMLRENVYFCLRKMHIYALGVCLSMLSENAYLCLENGFLFGENAYLCLGKMSIYAWGNACLCLGKCMFMLGEMPIYAQVKCPSVPR